MCTGGYKILNMTDENKQRDKQYITQLTLAHWRYDSQKMQFIELDNYNKIYEIPRRLDFDFETNMDYILPLGTSTFFY